MQLTGSSFKEAHNLDSSTPADQAAEEAPVSFFPEDDAGTQIAIQLPTLPAVLREPWSLRRASGMLRLFGPAAILASVSIGAGETIVAVRAGAWLGYGLLWLVLLSALVKGVCVTYFLGRYTAVSGESPSGRLVRLPGPRGWLLIFLVVLEMAAAPALWAAIARPSGELLGYLIFGAGAGAWPQTFATLFVAVALLVSLPTNYRSLERQQVVICGILVVGTMIGTVLVQPNLVATLKGLIAFGRIPTIPPSAPIEFQQNVSVLLAVTFGYIGGSVMTYLVYPDFIALHGWGMTGHPQIAEIRRRAAVGKPADFLPPERDFVAAVSRSISPLRWDVACGAVVLFVVTASFMIAGAAVLFPLREAGGDAGAFGGWRLLTDQASIWQSIHPSLDWVYYICVLAGLWGTLQAYPDIYSRGITEYARTIWPHQIWHQRRIQVAVSIYVFATASYVIWSDFNFNTLTLIVAFLATNLGVTIAMLAGLYLNHQLPPAYRTRWWMHAAGVASAVVLLYFTIVTGADVWQQFVDTIHTRGSK